MSSWPPARMTPQRWNVECRRGLRYSSPDIEIGRQPEMGHMLYNCGLASESLTSHFRANWPTIASISSAMLRASRLWCRTAVNVYMSALAGSFQYLTNFHSRLLHSLRVSLL